MIKKKLLILGISFLILANLIAADYSAPSYNSVNFTLNSGYTAPNYQSVNLTLGPLGEPDINYFVALPLGLIRFLN